MTTNETDDQLFTRTQHTRASARAATRAQVQQKLPGVTVAEAMIDEICEAWLARPWLNDANYRSGLRPFTRDWLAANHETWTAEAKTR